MGREQVEPGLGLTRRRLLRKGVKLAAGLEATLLLAGCGGRADSGKLSIRELEKSLPILREQHTRMETEIDILDRLMDNLQKAAVAVIGRATDTIDDRLFQPFDTHIANKAKNHDRNFYTIAIDNAEALLARNSQAKIQGPNPEPEYYTYHFLDGSNDRFSTFNYEFKTRSLGVREVDPDNLLDAIDFYHETIHAHHDGLWIANTKGDPEAEEARKKVVNGEAGVVLEMEIDAHLRSLNMINLISNGAYMDAVIRNKGKIRFKDFQKIFRARDDQAKDFEGEAERLAYVADIKNGAFVNSPDFAQAIALGYRSKPRRVYGQHEIHGAPDFLAA